MNVGDAYLDVSPGVPEHLWFVCTQPDLQGCVVVLNLTSQQPWTKDLSCILKAGDHPFVVRDTVVFYQRGLIVAVTQIQAEINNGVFRPKDPASPQLMARIRRGALNSSFTPRTLKKAIAACPWKPGP